MEYIDDKIAYKVRCLHMLTENILIWFITSYVKTSPCNDSVLFIQI